jgi:5-methylcytosine-specific restriction protein B
MCTFHPAYGYEDFLEGYHPDERDGRLVFRLEDGIFKRMCKDAADRADRDFFLVIDEINRGDIPRIFGELLTVLEKNKRGKAVTLPLSKTAFTVPPNVYVIGTMNTADRSIALLDTALRRRFAFVELMPDSGVLGETAVEGIPLGPWLDALNDRIREHLGRDARNLQVGHSYLMHDGTVVSDFPRFARVVRDDLIPLLEEYCYEDYRRLEQLLGSTLVDRERQSIRDELFDAKRRSHLVQALLEPCPEISTTQKAVEAEEAADEIEEEEEQDEEQQDEEDNERADADASDNP